MPPRPSCRSCRHCEPAAGVSWCRLRQVSLHPELTADLSCHHWTARAPELPDFQDVQVAGVFPSDSRQLPLVGLMPRA
jgi:hypothetical protein